MSQPVKLSDELVLEARQLGALAERSIAGQIEFWAKLGRAVEPLLQGAQVVALSRSVTARPLSTCLETMDSVEGRSRVAACLREQPFPHYESAPNNPGFLIRTEADGTKTIGRFVNREFQPIKSGSKAKRKRPAHEIALA